MQPTPLGRGAIVVESGLGASLILHRGLARAGHDRIALMEAIGELGSISAAARRVGLSYRAAWDAVQSMNNLFEVPLIQAAPGGRRGGGASITPRGVAVIQAYRRVQQALDATLTQLDDPLAQGHDPHLFWSLGMRTSARNALRGDVISISSGPVNAEVQLAVSDGVVLTAILTRRSIEALQLEVGKPAIALIKASFVLLALDDGVRTSARNAIRGVVARREDGAVNSEIAVAIGGGKTLTATVTAESAKALALDIGRPVIALVKASQVILAVE